MDTIRRFWDRYDSPIKALAVSLALWTAAFVLLNWMFGIAAAHAWCIDIGGGTYCF